MSANIGGSGIIKDGIVFALDPGSQASYNIPAPMRYIRWSANGSTSNSSTHFVELQANTSGGTNRALSASVSIISGQLEMLQSRIDVSVITNGTTTTADYVGFHAGGATLQIDLGAIYSDITEIKIWNYYADGRTYNDVSISISTDNSSWTTIFGPESAKTTSAGIPIPNKIKEIATNTSSLSLIDGPTYSSNNRGIFVFNGTSDYIDLWNISDSFWSQSSWTASFWVNMAATNKGLNWDNSFLTHGQPTTDNGLHLTERNGVSYFGFYDDDFSGTTTLLANTWYNICYQYDLSTQSRYIYLNGNLEATSPVTKAAYGGKEKNTRVGAWVLGQSARTNLLPNPSFERGLVGWNVYFASLTNELSKVGPTSVKIVTGTNFYYGAVESTNISVLPSTRYSAGAWIKIDSLPQNQSRAQIGIVYLRSNGSYITESNTNISVNNNWTYYKIENSLSPQDAAFAYVRVFTTTDNTAILFSTSGTFYIDGVVFEQGTTSPSYFDGENVSDSSALVLQNYWNGQSNASTSFLRTVSAPPASRYMNGSMGQIIVYNRLLSQSEIQQNYNLTKSRYGL